MIFRGLGVFLLVFVGDGVVLKASFETGELWPAGIETDSEKADADGRLSGS
jgi:hypothetical protein